MIITTHHADKIVDTIRSCKTPAHLETCKAWLKGILPSKAMPQIEQAINRRHIELQTANTKTNDTRQNSRGNRIANGGPVHPVAHRMAGQAN